MRTFTQQVTDAEVYKREGVPQIPNGYVEVGFRPPQVGETFISTDRGGTVLTCTPTYKPIQPRIIVRKAPTYVLRWVSDMARDKRYTYIFRRELTTQTFWSNANPEPLEWDGPFEVVQEEST